MAEQLSLLDWHRELRARDMPASIDERFERWLAKNSHVYDVMVRLAREEKACGARRIGAKALAERCRWELKLSTRGDDYRINNSFVAPLVRLIQAREPDLANLFETRKRKAADR